MSQEGMAKAAKGMDTDSLSRDLERLNKKEDRSDSEELRRKIVEKEYHQRPVHERVAAEAKRLVERK